MMLGEESESADYWKQCGDEALANGIKGVIMMVSLQISKRYSQTSTEQNRELTGMQEEI